MEKHIGWVDSIHVRKQDDRYEVLIMLKQQHPLVIKSSSIEFLRAVGQVLTTFEARREQLKMEAPWSVEMATIETKGEEIGWDLPGKEELHVVKSD